MPRPETLQDGDRGYSGVNIRLDPGQLPSGFVSSAKNKRFNNGVAETRFGIKKVMWANFKNVGPNLNQGLTKYDDVRGLGSFNDPDGINWLLVATETKIYAVREGNPIRTLNTGMANVNNCTFVQCFNTVILFRGENLAPLQMVDIHYGFESISQTSSDVNIDENDSDGTETIPNAENGLFFQNRLLIPHLRDLVAASDYLNYTRYQPVLASFRVNQGSEDKLIALWKYDSSTILCFKESSVYAVRNIYGNLADVFLDEITRGYGLKSAKAVVTVGKDIWFLSDQRGVVSLSVSESGKLQGLDIPVSEPIQPIIDRINWPYAQNATATWHNNKYYLAVPLDDATTNNAILVYDFTNQAWSGYDESSEITGLTDFITYNYIGAKRLFFMAGGFINLYDDAHLSGFFDEKVDPDVNDARNILHLDISDEITTRGYKCGVEDLKRFQQANVVIETNGVVTTATPPTTGIDMTLLFDGVQETQAILENKVFSRVKYHQPFDKADFIQDNSGGDYMTPFREDYSTDFTVNTLDTVTVANPSATVAIGGSVTVAVNALTKALGKNNVITFSGGGVLTLSASADAGDTSIQGELVTSAITAGQTGTYKAVDFGSGINPDAHQSSVQKIRFNKSGRYAQIKISNDVGRTKVVSTAISALPGKTMVTERL